VCDLGTNIYYGMDGVTKHDIDGDELMNGWMGGWNDSLDRAA
jgi:hypothetical protein